MAKSFKPSTDNHSNSNNIAPTFQAISSTPEQLDLFIQKQIEIDGVGMGVLSDGTPFLTSRGLARLCGVNSGRITEMANAWDNSGSGTMTSRVKEILLSRGVVPAKPYIAINQGGGGKFLAYSDLVCLAVLEFYAFDAPTISETAKTNYRKLAGKALAEFIFAQVGYDPTHSVPDEWRQFHDRLSLTYDSLPRGYFGIFKEMADMIVTLGQAGLQIDSQFVPDISVGILWAKHWTDNGFDMVYGQRIRWEHNYPEYFPQAQSNPQPAWAYPEMALGEFRRWLRDDYIGRGRFAHYVTQKVKQKELPASFASLAIAAYAKKNPKQIE